MRKQFRDDKQAVGRATGRARQTENEGAAAHSGDLPRQGGRRKVPAGLRAHALGEAGNLELHDGSNGLGRTVARGDSGSAGQQDQVGRSGVGHAGNGRRDALPIIRQNQTIHDHVGHPGLSERLFAGRAAQVRALPGGHPV